MVLRYTDILGELNFTAVGRQMDLLSVVSQDGQESKLLTCIIYEPVHMDNIQMASGLPVATINNSLAMVEIKGLVKQVGGINYIRTREAQAEYRVSPR